MALKFVLRPGEKMVINGAVIGVGEKRGEIFLFNNASFLRGREVMKEDEADTIEKKMYFVIQLAYLFPDDALLNLSRFHQFYQQVRSQHEAHAAELDEIAQAAQDRNLYRALKLCARFVRRIEKAKQPARGSAGTDRAA